MKNLYTILEGIFDEETQMDKIDQDVIIGQLKKKHTPSKYEKIWKNILAPYKLKKTTVKSLLHNDHKVIRIKLYSGSIHTVRICGWGDKSTTYPKCIEFYNNSINEYHIDLTDKCLDNNDEQVYELPNELEWLFEINIK